jgi:hypothetical protein
MRKTHLRSIPLVLGTLLSFAAPARATGTPTAAQASARLAAARPTLSAARVRQLDSLEAAIDRTPGRPPANLDSMTTEIVGNVPTTQLLSFEAMALADLVAKRDAEIDAKAHALADVLDHRSTVMGQLTAARQAGQATTSLQDKLDSLSDQSETQSLELQMIMDRRSKLMDALSNVLKKISDTGDSIVQNLK